MKILIVILLVLLNGCSRKADPLIYEEVKKHIHNMTALSDLYYLKKYTMAFNRRMFFPNKWGPIKRIEDK